MKLVIRIAADREGSYRAWCPALPGCEIEARSVAAARESIDRVVRGYMASFNVPADAEVDEQVLVG